MTAETTIIVNVYNGERYVADCLDSILALHGPWGFKALIVDDASTDETPKILQRYKDPRFRIIRFSKNVGAAAAINHAFSLVRSEFVARIDYDDRYNPNFLVDSIDALKQCPEAAFVCAAVRMIDPEGVPGSVCSPADNGEEPGCRDRFTSMLERNFVTAPTILGRTRHWLQAIPVPAGMDFCDWYMNLTVAETAPVAVIDKVTADYRIHPLNMHATKIRTGMGECVTFEVLNQFLNKSPRGVEFVPRANAIMAQYNEQI